MVPSFDKVIQKLVANRWDFNETRLRRRINTSLLVTFILAFTTNDLPFKRIHVFLWSDVTFTAILTKSTHFMGEVPEKCSLLSLVSLEWYNTLSVTWAVFKPEKYSFCTLRDNAYWGKCLMTRFTGCKQLYVLVPGIAVAWNYAEKRVSLNSS